MADTYLPLPDYCEPWGPLGPRIHLPGSPSYVDGTDISDVLFWLFTRAAFDGVTTAPGIGSGPYAALSGTSETSRTVFQFPAGLTSWIEKGFKLGLPAKNKGVGGTYLPGYDWPDYEAHAFRHVRIESDDPDNRHVLWQEDDTVYDSGIIPDPKGGGVLRVSTTANSTTAVLQNALTVNQAARLNADGASIQSAVTGVGDPTYPATAKVATAGSNVIYLGTALGIAARGFVDSVQSVDGTLFPNGQYGSSVVSINTSAVTVGGTTYNAGRVITLADNALHSASNLAVTFFNPTGHPFDGGTRGEDVTSVDVDRKTLTLANPAYWTRTNESATLYLSAVRPERADGVPLIVVDGPGDWGSGLSYDERGAYSYDITIDDIIVRGSNALDLSGIAGAENDNTGREQWIAINPRRVTGLVMDGTDVVYQGNGLSVGEGVTIQHSWSDALFLGGSPEDITFSAKVNGCGRHFVTYQGCVGLRVHRSLSKNNERLGIDVETTSVTARNIDAEFTDCVVSPGTALAHFHPAALIPEPSRAVDGITTTIGSRFVTAPAELIKADDRGATLEHANLPTGTYIRRRLSPTLFEVSQAATATGTADGIQYGAVLFRDFTLRNIGLFTTNGNVPLDSGPAQGKVYFTYLVDTATDVHKMVDIQFDTRHDGQTFTTADIGTSKVFWGQGGVPGTGLFPGNAGVPTAHTSTTLTFTQTSANSTPATDWTITGSTIAGSTNVISSISLTNADVKSHFITAPAGVFRENTFIERLGDSVSKTIELNVPAKLTGSFTMTISKRAHGYFAGDDTVRWTGFNFEEIRPLTDSLWNGTGLVDAPLNQPWIMAPVRTDGVTISRNFGLGQLQLPGSTVARYIAGAYAGSGAGAPVYGEPSGYSFTIEDNYGPTTSTTGMVDNQRSTPTKTVSLVMTVESDVSDQPVFTVVGTRSDGQSLDGYAIVIVRDGTNVGPGIFTGNTCVFRSEDFTSPLDPGDGPRSFWARWGNSYGGNYETLGSTSNTITIRPGDAEPLDTTTVLVVTPSSPQVEGSPITLTATVTPDPSLQAGTVSFYDGATLLSTHDIAAGEAERILATGRPAGSHSFTAVFNGNAGFNASTSTAVSYTTTAAPSAVDTTTTLAALPPDTHLTDHTVFLNATVTPASGPSVTGGRVNYYDGSTLLGNPVYGTPLELTFADEGTHSLTATYVGNASWNTSTSGTMSYEVVLDETDTTLPFVAGIEPFDGESGVFRGTEITVTFSEEISGPIVTVEDAVTHDVVTCDTTNEQEDVESFAAVWTLTPTDLLRPSREYAITITDASDGFSNVMDPFHSSFTTGATELATEYRPQANLVARGT